MWQLSGDGNEGHSDQQGYDEYRGICRGFRLLQVSHRQVMTLMIIMMVMVVLMVMLIFMMIYNVANLANWQKWLICQKSVPNLVAVWSDETILSLRSGGKRLRVLFSHFLFKMPELFHPRAHINRMKEEKGATVEDCPTEAPATDGASSVLAGLLLLPLLVVHHL